MSVTHQTEGLAAFGRRGRAVGRLAVLASAVGLAVSACAGTPPPPSGLLSDYSRLTPREGGLRTAASEARQESGRQAISVISRDPVILAPGVGAWLSPAERATLLKEADAQLCFELSERFQLDGEPGAGPAQGRVRGVITRLEPTGQAASAFSAAAGFFTGPLDVRMPGSLGALAVEIELIADDRQAAALIWSRAAQPIGTDAPSLSRIGDALQFLEPFADDAGRTLSAEDSAVRRIPQPDPCEAFGPRDRPLGFLVRLVTNLYVPEAYGISPQN